MYLELTDEQSMIVDTTRDFLEKEIYPHEKIVEKTGEVPRELGAEIAKKCKEIGFFAANFPEELGGGGMNHLEFSLLERELGRGSNALTIFFGRPLVSLWLAMIYKRISTSSLQSKVKNLMH